MSEDILHTFQLKVAAVDFSETGRGEYRETTLSLESFYAPVIGNVDVLGLKLKRMGLSELEKTPPPLTLSPRERVRRIEVQTHF